MLEDFYAMRLSILALAVKKKRDIRGESRLQNTFPIDFRSFAD